MSSWTNLPPFTVTAATSISRMDQLLDNITVLSTHSHTGCPGQGASGMGINSSASRGSQSAIGSEQTIFPFFPDANSNWGSWVTCPNYHNGGAIKTTTNSACLTYSVLIGQAAPSGSLKLLIGRLTGSRSGCVSACFGTTVMSTLNLYAAADGSAIGQWGSITALVAASGVYTLRFKVTGSDVSSAGYDAAITHIGIVYV